jgi:RNA polymerase sigma factor (sigma-70 family)
MPATSDAFSTFYENDHPRVLRSVTLILGDPTRSARITQEAFVRTHSAWRRVHGDRAFHYAMRCAFRLAWRARSTDEADLVLEDDPIEPIDHIVLSASRADHADAAIDLRDDPSGRDTGLELALSSLPRAQRSVIVFWYYLGFDERAIAEVMSIRESQVMVHLERARTRLMALLGEDRSGVA